MTGDLIGVDPDLAGFAFDDLAFAGEFVERHAVLLDGGNHRRHLSEFAGEGIESLVDFRQGKRGHGFAFEHFALPVLGAGGRPERDGADVFLVLAHQQILDLGGAPDDQHEQAGGHRIERAAVADFLGVQRPAGDGHHVVRRHVGRLVN